MRQTREGLNVRSMWMCSVAMAAMVAAMAVGLGCSRSDESTVGATGPGMPPGTGVGASTASGSGPERRGMVVPPGESAPGESEGSETEGQGELPASVEELMEDVVAPSARAIQAALQAKDLETVAAEAARIRDAAEVAPTLKDAPADQAALDEFTGYADDMVTDASALLDAAAAGDAAKATEAGETLQKGCKACHDVFRKE